MDDSIDFTGNHKANVDSETGERLIDERDDITAVSDTDDVPADEPDAQTDADAEDDELGDHYLDDQPERIVTDSDDTEADSAE